MVWTAYADGVFSSPGVRAPCALGRGGVVAAAAKREGDGASPAGLWRLRFGFWRADRLEKPESGLVFHALRPDDGWCDDPADRAYNRFVRLPYPASCETMMREDALYDVVVVLDHNDAPPAPGAGSAIFLHCAKPGYPPTEGCVALTRADLLTLLKTASPGQALEISAQPSAG